MTQDELIEYLCGYVREMAKDPGCVISLDRNIVEGEPKNDCMTYLTGNRLTLEVRRDLDKVSITAMLNRAPDYSIINDKPKEHWAILAARRVHLRFDLQAHAPQDTSIAALAHIIFTAAEPLKALLREAKREHDKRCDLLQHPRTEYIRGETPRQDKVRLLDNNPLLIHCTCGADDWNRRVSSALHE